MALGGEVNLISLAAALVQAASRPGRWCRVIVWCGDGRQRSSSAFPIFRNIIAPLTPSPIPLLPLLCMSPLTISPVIEFNSTSKSLTLEILISVTLPSWCRSGSGIAVQETVRSIDTPDRLDALRDSSESLDDVRSSFQEPLKSLSQDSAFACTTLIV